MWEGPGRAGRICSALSCHASKFALKPKIYSQETGKNMHPYNFGAHKAEARGWIPAWLPQIQDIKNTRTQKYKNKIEIGGREA